MPPILDFVYPSPYTPHFWFRQRELLHHKTFGLHISPPPASHGLANCSSPGANHGYLLTCVRPGSKSCTACCKKRRHQFSSVQQSVLGHSKDGGQQIGFCRR